ncbi:hypothetical protein CKO15_07080 [Halorhodospira abdelmalekii]|uniref:DUF2066 domain-containing protein n=1 Tax=Halorhodospira abdelmalekii TaxID=421629 RepID=UPI001902CB09|nr:DUF2066 domain-containing protein [Halorhodospira abdelmalekii]MBK1735051.1 hypothetical protein [Halorhodospira abdelmalekii]
MTGIRQTRRARPVRPCGWGRALRWLLPVLALLGGMVMAVGSAAASESIEQRLLSVEVDVAGRSAEARRGAAVDALERLLELWTGEYTGLAEDHPGRALFAEAERFIEGYRYVSGDAGLRIELRFDGAAVRGALGEQGVAVWDHRRRPLLLWAGIEVDGERFLLGSHAEGQPQAVAEAAAVLREQSREYGLPLILPLLDLEDRGQVRFSDIWGGFDDRLREASIRYGQTTLIGAGLRQTSAGAWRGRWQAIIGEDQITYQTGPGSLEAVVGAAFAQLGSYFVERFAGVPGEGAGERLQLTIAGVEGLADYATLISYLRGVAGVERVLVRQAAGEELTVELRLAQSPERVVGALERSVYLAREPGLDERSELPDEYGEHTEHKERAEMRGYRWRGG